LRLRLRELRPIHISEIHKEKEVMANLRNKIFGLAGASLMFAGMAFGQAATCGSINANGLGQIARAESLTDLVAETTLTCTTTAGVAVAASTAPTAAAITLFVGAPVTSKLLQTAALPAVQYTEALAIVSIAGGFPATVGSVSDFVNTSAAALAGSVWSVTQGVITPAGISFTGIPTPALTGMAGSTSYQIEFVNVRVNATGGTTSISEQAFVTGSSILNPGAPPSTVVATVTKGLNVPTVSSDQANAKTITTTPLNTLVCNALAAQTGSGLVVTNPATTANTAVQTPLFWIHVGEAFQTAFKTQGPGNPAAVGGTANNNTLNSEFVNNTETGFVPAGTALPGGSPAPAFLAFNQVAGNGNIANSGTRIQILLSNIPTGMALYTPSVVNNDGSTTALSVTGTLSLTSTLTGAFSAPAATTASGSFSSFTGTPTNFSGSAAGGYNAGAISPVTVSGTSATIVYEVTAQSPQAVESYSIPVFAVASAGTLAVSTAPISATVSFAPIATSTTAPLANIPSFISLSTALNVSNESSCSTTLLFPYLTQGAGFDVGIAIENTSSDNLGTAGKTSATNQSGTCALNFYGTGGSITPSAAGTPFQNTGGTTAFTFTTGAGAANLLSAINPGFTGYMIASCNFQFAHGYAYIFTNYGTANATVTSYLPLVLPTGNGARGGAEFTNGAEMASH
jgi:hypothetical protein